MKTKLISAIIYCTFSITSLAQTTIPGGTVSGTWAKANSPYLIQGDLTIEGTSTLIIEPGTRIEFQGRYKLTAVGRLLAVGNVNDTIRFTAVDQVAGWKGIRFGLPLESNDTSRIRYCLLQYARSTGDVWEESGGALFFDHASKVVVSNSTITNCSATFGAAIYSNKSDVFFMENKIINNETSKEGTLYLIGSGLHILKNSISYNIANSGGGIYCGSSSQQSKITNNFISNNIARAEGGGIHLSDDATVSNNVIVNNSAVNGGGISCSRNKALIINNTIANNLSQKGGGLSFSINANPILKNNIIWGNTAAVSGTQLYVNDDESDPDAAYCTIQEGIAGIGKGSNATYTGIYQNNTNVIPSFMNASAGSGTSFDGVTADWRLNTSSPCINGGDPNGGPYPSTDIAGNPRVLDGKIDIGAYESIITGIKNILLQSLFNLYPNPSNGQFTVESEKRKVSSITIYNVLGEQVFSKQIVDRKFTIDLKEQPKGIYFVNLLVDEEMCVKKIIIQ